MFLAPVGGSVFRGSLLSDDSSGTTTGLLTERTRVKSPSHKDLLCIPLQTELHTHRQRIWPECKEHNEPMRTRVEVGSANEDYGRSRLNQSSMFTLFYQLHQSMTKYVWPMGYWCKHVLLGIQIDLSVLFCSDCDPWYSTSGRDAS